MKNLLFCFALLAAPLPTGAQPAPSLPVLDLEQRMLLRCSAAFALVADRQQRGEDWAAQYPPMGEAGQDFFVAAIARVMEEAGLSDQDAAGLLREEAQTLLDQDLLSAVMPACLRLLKLSEM